MFNNIKRVAAVIALTGWMGVANASLIFDFSFGTTGNELIGEITGLVDGIDEQLQSAERIRFTSATGIYSAFINIEYYFANGSVKTLRNEFLISNDQIIMNQLAFTMFKYSYDPNDDDRYEFELSDGAIFAYIDLTGTFLFANANQFNGFVLRVDPPNPDPNLVQSSCWRWA
jgi:hypothetical protein